MNIRFVLVLMAGLMFLSLPPVVAGGEIHHRGQIEPPAEMIGHWEGYGHEIVTWCQADSIFFSLDIHPDGSVSGIVGDAELQDGFIRLNGWIERKFGNPEYFIGGKLKGPLVASEDIYRDSLHGLLVDLKDDHLVGGFHTSGSKGNPFGDNESWKKKMKMTGSDVFLTQTGQKEN